MSPSENTYTPEALELAQRVVYELSGRRVVWPALTTTEMFAYPARSKTTFRLTGTPIHDIESVELVSPTGDVIDTLEYRRINASRVQIIVQGVTASSVGSVACGSGNEIAVTYSYGAKPPRDIQTGIIELAEDYSLLMRDEAPINEGCSLPPGVKSVNTRGFSLDMEDTSENAAEGLTGINSLDRALARYNQTGARSRSRLYSPTFPPTTRTNTHTRV